MSPVPLFVTDSLLQWARALRRNMTEAEKRLWKRVQANRFHGRHFYRQRIIGPYVVDFYCPSADLVIEVDGQEHFRPDGASYDRQRDEDLRSRGLRVLRFTDGEVLRNLEGVMKRVGMMIEVPGREDS